METKKINDLTKEIERLEKDISNNKYKLAELMAKKEAHKATLYKIDNALQHSEHELHERQVKREELIKELSELAAKLARA